MKPFRVFIVDDDVDFVEGLCMLLERRGYDVEVAYSGEEAIRKFRRQDFDVTFLDVKLPGKNGVESFLEIRKFKPNAKVVMMTGFSLEQLLDQAMGNGAWGILYKPIEVRKILEILEKLKSEGIKSGGILIADDDSDFAENTKELLENKGQTVFIAKNGKEAIERICSNGIDILILDLRMPILDGLDTYLELKKIGHEIPTIIISAYVDQEREKINALESMSVSGILKKPFDPRELLELVKNLSGGK